MANVSQLIKKDNTQVGGYKKVFPKTYFGNIVDEQSGLSLPDVLSGFNMYFLDYVGNASETRLQVPSFLRKTGLWITYVMYDKTIIVEWYASDDIGDDAFREDSNWRKGNNILVGDITISSNGNWIINGVDSGIKAQGEQGITPILRVNNNKLEVSYTNGASFNVLSDYIAAWFRWVDTGNGVGKIQISRDSSSWSDLSPEFTNNLKIADYVSSVGELPSGVALGTIYGVGPTYDSSDTSHTNPIYTLYVYTSDGWLDNGHFTSIAAGIVQTIGGNENVVMSQKAVCDAVGLNEYPTFSASEAYSAGDVVNYNGKLYKFTADHAAGAWIGTDVEPYNLKKDIEERYGTYTDNPEFIRVYTDAEGKFLWGIRIDGSIEWAKGIPTPVQKAIRELEDKLKTQDIKSLQDAIDVINASLKPLTDTFSYQGNEEFAHVITDADGKVLFGIKTDGKPYYPNNEMYHVIQNDEYLAAWVDANNKLLFGIKTDGSVYIAKSEYIDAVKEIQEKLTEIEVITENFEVTDNPEFIATTVDNGGKLLEATKADGKKYFPKQALLDKYDDVEGRTEITLDAEERVLAYRDKEGIKHEEKLALHEVYDKDNNKINLAIKEDVEEVRDEIPNLSDINISELDGVQDHSLVNLFNKDNIRTYDSDFADKVFAKIGRKTAETGCYSNNIEAKEGDWFTRSDFGTGIIVALDENENILGDVANAAYQPTVQIVPSDPSKYDFSTIKYVVFVVMLENLDSERIVKAKYMPTGEGDYLTIPKLRVMSDNMDKDVITYIKSNSGRYYQLHIDDSGESPILSAVQLEGIPNAELPSDFPTFQVSGDFSQYYDGLVFSPVEGGVTNYLYELASNGLVKRYLKKKVNCPRVLKEGNTWYFYGVDGSLNSSNGKLNIYKANGETFELVKGNLGGGSDGSLQIEPHDCLVISVNPLHYIYQRYVGSQYTTVDGQRKRVTALHVGEIYEGNLLYEWHSEDYPELWVDSHVQGDNADYLHNNTICVSSDGNLYLNNKQANQIIVLKRTWDDEAHTATIGNILWKIGGNRTHSGWDVPTRIKTTTEQQWYESHDAVINSNGLITMYDNKASGASRILEFNIDTGNKQLTNFKAHTWQQYRGRYMGSADKLGEGIYLVSWGSQRNGNAANAGIYDFNNNKALFEIRFDNTGSSAYRVYGIPKGQE